MIVSSLEYAKYAVLRASFTDPVAHGMTLGATKAFYSIAFGLGPYFHEEIVNDMKNSWYTLLVDETTTDQNVKLFDIHARCWSRAEDNMVRKYVASSFLGHARAGDLKTSIMEALSKDCLPLVKMLHLGCDGPNVNKSLKNQLNESIVQLGGKPLIDIGSCNLHVVHNGFHAGISSVDQSWGVEDLMSDLFTFFKKYSSRAEDFTVIQEALNMEKKALKRFVSNRWLSVGPVCERIIENWAGLTKYFLKTEHSAPIKESSMYKRIATSLQEGNIMLARLHFIVSIANLFKPFLTKFQSESVLIHLLFEELAQVLRLLLQRFVKVDALKDKNGAQLLSVPLDSRPAQACEFGAHTLAVLKSLKKDSNP